MGLAADFYGGRAADHRARSLVDYWAFDADALEENHDFIQWMFPTVRESALDVPAPVLSEEDIAEFRGSPDLRARLLRSLDLMLCFYGFARVEGPGGPEVRRAPSFAERAAHWILPGSHNYLRLSRILDCTATLGLREHSAALLRCLEGVHREHGDRIGEFTLDRWRECGGARPSPGGTGAAQGLPR